MTPGEPSGGTSKRAITPETEIRVTDPFELDEVFLSAVSESNLLDVEYGDDGEIARFEIDPRVLRSVMFLYASQERTRHDWR